MSKFRAYTFRLSHIWTAHDPIDESRAPVRIKAKNEERARAHLPEPGMGRKWLLVNTEERS